MAEHGHVPGLSEGRSELVGGARQITSFPQRGRLGKTPLQRQPGIEAFDAKSHSKGDR